MSKKADRLLENRGNSDHQISEIGRLGISRLVVKYEGWKSKARKKEGQE